VDSGLEIALTSAAAPDFCGAVERSGGRRSMYQSTWDAGTPIEDDRYALFDEGCSGYGESAARGYAWLAH